MRARCGALMLAAVWAASVVPSRASAQPSGADAARAEQLFKHARALIAENRVEQACAEFEESQRLDPAPGTLLNLADCHEKAGKFASAWAAYRALLPEASRLAQRDREAYAAERIAALERRVSRLSLEFAPGVAVDALQVELDGKPLDAATVRGEFPIDGGGHRVRVSSPGYEPWIGHVALAREKDRKSLKVPPLRPMPAAPPSAPGAVAAEVPDAEPARGSGPPAAVIALGAGTLVLAAGAGITGALAVGKANDFEDANEDPAFTPDQRRELRDEAQSMALVSTVLTGAAVVAGGVTLVLYLSRPSAAERPPPSARLRVTPWIGASGAGLGVAGSL